MTETLFWGPISNGEIVAITIEVSFYLNLISTYLSTINPSVEHVEDTYHIIDNFLSLNNHLDWSHLNFNQKILRYEQVLIEQKAEIHRAFQSSTILSEVLARNPFGVSR